MPPPAVWVKVLASRSTLACCVKRSARAAARMSRDSFAERLCKRHQRIGVVGFGSQANESVEQRAVLRHHGQHRHVRRPKRPAGTLATIRAKLPPHRPATQQAAADAAHGGTPERPLARHYWVST